MTVKITDTADLELGQAIDYYNNKEMGLGNKFLAEIDESIELIKKWPKTWQLISKRTHRFIMRKFPYILLYAIIDNAIIITCIGHQKRRPEYFIEKIL